MDISTYLASLLLQKPEIASHILMRGLARGKSKDAGKGDSTYEIDPMAVLFGIIICVLYHISMFHFVNCSRCQV